MKSMGWILFVVAAIVCVVIWQHGSYQLGETARQFQRDRQDLASRGTRSEERVEGQLQNVRSSIAKHEEELAAKRQEKAELEARVKELEQRVASVSQQKDRMETHLPRLETILQEMK